MRKGDLVAVLSKWEGTSGATDTITDSIGTKYQQAGPQVRNSTNNDLEGVWYIGVAQKSASSVTVKQTLSSARPWRQIAAASFPCAPGYYWDLTPSLIASASGQGDGSSSAIITAAFTPLGPGIAIHGSCYYASRSYAPNTGWLEAYGSGGTTHIAYRAFSETPGSITGGSTVTGGNTQYVAMVFSVFARPRPTSTPFGLRTPVAAAAFFPPTGAYILTCDVGTYTLNGVAANTLVGRLLTSDAGSYALTGVSANVLKGYLLTANTGSYSLVGIDASLLKTWLLSGAAGSYSLTGVDATLTYNAGTNSYTLVCDAGSYTLSGQDAATLVSYLLVSNAGSYTLTGQAANTLAGRLLTADAGSYTQTGVAANILKTYLITGDPGSYIITGMPAVLNYSGEAPVTSVAEFKALGLSLMRLGGIK